ncbi:hypothetical protein BDZ88DRAFT_468674 [Geranomyces variabilis]|nr:hypothetical protein BDZ88DRAFT_468674 [Geranomyces variabilis]KAJ3140146.1 hypothetical protein HDU90_008370 [Geranomyces variabilis]
MQLASRYVWLHEEFWLCSDGMAATRRANMLARRSSQKPFGKEKPGNQKFQNAARPPKQQQRPLGQPTPPKLQLQLFTSTSTAALHVESRFPGQLLTEFLHVAPKRAVRFVRRHVYITTGSAIRPTNTAPYHEALRSHLLKADVSHTTAESTVPVITGALLQRRSPATAGPPTPARHARRRSGSVELLKRAGFPPPTSSPAAVAVASALIYPSPLLVAATAPTHVSAQTRNDVHASEYPHPSSPARPPSR